MNTEHDLTMNNIYVMSLIARGMGAPEIGREMGTHRRTVEGHFIRIKRYYNARSIGQAMYKAGKDPVISKLVDDVEKLQMTRLQFRRQRVRNRLKKLGKQL